MEQKGNKNVMLIIVILLILLLTAVVGLSIFAVITLNKLKDANNNADPQQTETASILMPEDLVSVELDARTTNLLVGEDLKRHFIQIQISVSIDNTQKESAAFIELANANKDIFTDAMLNVCSGLTAEILLSRDGRDILKERLIAEFRRRFNSNLIAGINIMDLKVQ